MFMHFCRYLCKYIKATEPYAVAFRPRLHDVRFFALTSKPMVTH